MARLGSLGLAVAVREHGEIHVVSCQAGGRVPSGGGLDRMKNPSLVHWLFGLPSFAFNEIHAWCEAIGVLLPSLQMSLDLFVI